MTTEEMKVFDWEDEIEKDEQFVTLEEGDYLFKVKNFERGLQDKTEKLPQCNKAVMTLGIYAKDDTAFASELTTITENFPMCSAMEWKIGTFFNSTGLKKHGEKVKMNWPAAIGRTGSCRIKKVPGKQEGTYFNNVGKYYDFVETKAGDDTWS